MRMFRRRAAERPEGKALKAHLRRSNERQAELETLQFLLTTIKKRHTWDRPELAPSAPSGRPRDLDHRRLPRRR